MKQQLPVVKGFALCEQCRRGPLRSELRKHNAYTRRTYSGNLATWTLHQIHFLAQSLGIDLEKYKKGHKSHVIPSEESEPISADEWEIDLEGMPNTNEAPNKFTTFGEQFLSLMERRPDINRSIKEVLRSKLGPQSSTDHDSCRQHNVPNPSIPPVNQPFPPLSSLLSPLPLPLPAIYQPPSHPSTPINSTHNFGYNNFCTSSTALPPPPHPTGNININFNLHLSNEMMTNFDVASLFSEIDNAITLSLHRHATLLHNMQFTNVQLQFQTTQQKMSNTNE